MMPRATIRSYVLEWGTASDEPGSRVCDHDGRLVFTRSRVCSISRRSQVGFVEQLVSPEEIVVHWSDEAGDVHLSPREVVVLEALPSTS